MTSLKALSIPLLFTNSLSVPLTICNPFLPQTLCWWWTTVAFISTLTYKISLKVGKCYSTAIHNTHTDVPYWCNLGGCAASFYHHTPQIITPLSFYSQLWSIDSAAMGIIFASHWMNCRRQRYTAPLPPQFVTSAYKMSLDGTDTVDMCKHWLLYNMLSRMDWKEVRVCSVPIRYVVRLNSVST